MKTLQLLFVVLITTCLSLQAQAQCVATVEANTDGPICAGENVTLTVSIDSEDNDCANNNCYDVLWEWGDESEETNGFSNTIAFDETTEITVTVIGDCNQVADLESVTITVEVAEAPSFSIVLSNDSEPLCTGNDISLQLEGTYPNDIINYNWSNNVDNETDSFASIDNISGDETVACTITDEFTCTYDASIFLEVNPTPVIDLEPSGNGVYCEGVPFSIVASPEDQNDAGFDSCEWTVETDFQVNPTDCTVSINSAVVADHNGEWSVEVTDNNGCVASGTVDIVINPDPEVTIMADEDEVCPGADPVQLSVFPSNGTYSFDVGGSCDNPDNDYEINPFSNQFDPSLSGDGSFCICYTVEQNDCETTECINIEVSSPSTPAFDSNLPSTCENGPAIDLTELITPALLPGQQGVFSVNNGCAEGNNLDPSDDCVFVGFNNIEYTLTDADGCVSQASAAIQIYPELTLSQTGNTYEVCTGTDVPLNAGPNGGNDDSYSINWTPAADLSSTTVENPTVINPSQTETYTVTLEDANGCTASADHLVKVFDQPVIIEIIQDPTSFCAGQSDIEVSLINNWDDNDWSVNVEHNYNWIGGSVSGSPNSSVTVDEVIDETLQVGITVDFSTASGCSTVSDTYLLEPVPDPAPTLITNQTSICSGEQAIFTATNTTPGTAFEWDITPEPSTFEIIGNGNVAIATWENQTGSANISVEESLVSCFGSDNISVTLSNNQAPESAEINAIGEEILVYSDSSPDCYRWGYIDGDGTINYLVNPITDEPEIFQTVVLNEFNESYIYFCEAWNGDCSAPDCAATSFYDDAFVGILESNGLNAMSIFPNPSSGLFWVELNAVVSGKLSYEVFNSMGQRIETGALSNVGANGRTAIDLAHLSSNLYQIIILDESGVLGRSGIIIQH